MQSFQSNWLFSEFQEHPHEFYFVDNHTRLKETNAFGEKEPKFQTQKILKNFFQI